MPDWITHVLLAWAAVEVISFKYPRVLKYRGVVLIGSVLPDLGHFTLLLGETGSRLSYYFFPLHSPLGIGLLILGISFLARKNYRRLILPLLALGAYLHLATDFLIVTLTGKLPLLFPFSFDLFGYGIFYQGGWIFPVIAGILAISTSIFRKFTTSGDS